METELVQINSFPVWHHISEILNYLLGPVLVADIVEDDVDGLTSNLFEVQLWPDMRLQLS